jgi:hypothetical protein
VNLNNIKILMVIIFPLAYIQDIIGKNGFEYKFPINFWMGAWPLHSQDQSLMFLRNTIFARYTAVSWHSKRCFP